jgi:hypothetical protein
VVQQLTAHAHATPVEAARAVIADMVTLNRSAPQLHRVMRWLGTQYAEHPPVQAAHARLRQTLRDFLARSMPVSTAERVGFLLMHLVEAAVHAIVLDAPAHLDTEELVRETERIVEGYLQATAADTETRASRRGRRVQGLALLSSAPG